MGFVQLVRLAGRTRCSVRGMTTRPSGPEGPPKVRHAAVTVRQRFRLPVLAAALAVIPIIWIEETTSNAELLMAAQGGNWIIWGIFAGEYAALAVADRRWWRTREAWLDLAIVAVSFPMLGAVFATARLLRLLRLLRLGRVVAAIAKVGVVFHRRGFTHAMALFGVIALVAAGLFAVFEGQSLIDGLWWAMVTLTTVGYGDLSPATAGGRVVAVALMLTSIGIVSVVTANIAAFFVGDDADHASTNVEERLEAIEKLIVEHSSCHQSPDQTHGAASS